MEKMYSCGMDVLHAIETRRSIRKYKDTELSKDQIDTIICAGMCAPSAHNFRPWEFVVVKDREKLGKIADFGKYMKMVSQSAVSIIVCGDTEKQNRHDFLINDCSAAVQNILLAAHGLSLGAVWCGISYDEQISFFRDLLKLPEKIIPTALIAVGYPDDEKTLAQRFDETKIHYDEF